jgi:hypothetical protein
MATPVTHSASSRVSTPAPANQVITTSYYIATTNTKSASSTISTPSPVN